MRNDTRIIRVWINIEMEILKVENLSFSYPGSNRPALRNISFSMQSGEMLLVCGETGCGKTTLLRLLKKELRPAGDAEGRVLFMGEEIESLDARRSASDIGFVMQRPEHQIVCDRVYAELAFGLESLGTEGSEMRRRIAETAAYFGIEELYEQSTDSLSGGQKQLLNLAAVSVMGPRLLILDEPTARLDPVAKVEFLQALKRLNRETGVAVILAEHALEEALPLCDTLIILQDGAVKLMGETREICGELCKRPPLPSSFPAALRLFAAAPKGQNCPISVREGREYVQNHFPPGTMRPATLLGDGRQDPALDIRGLRLRYSKNSPDVLRSASLKVRTGEICCLMGANGSGKSTLMSAAAGLIRPYAGEIRVFGKPIEKYSGGELYTNCVSMLPQDAQSIFLHSKVRDELAESKITPEELPFDALHMLERHPYDLSGGEQQLLALGKVLGTRPRLLLLDEPTNGVDARLLEELTDILKKLRAEGASMLIITQDTELAAELADRCCLMFRGEIIAEDIPQRFLDGGSFYTTAVNRICRGHLDGCVRLSDAMALIHGQEERL